MPHTTLYGGFLAMCLFIVLLPSPAAGEEPAPGANGKIPRSAPERPTSPGLVQQAGLEPLPASPSRLSVRRQNESPRSMHGDGPYCYLNNPGFEPCPLCQFSLQRKTEPTLSDSLVLDKTRYQRNAVVQCPGGSVGHLSLLPRLEPDTIGRHLGDRTLGLFAPAHRVKPRLKATLVHPLRSSPSWLRSAQLAASALTASSLPSGPLATLLSPSATRVPGKTQRIQVAPRTRGTIHSLHPPGTDHHVPLDPPRRALARNPSDRFTSPPSRSRSPGPAGLGPSRRRPGRWPSESRSRREAPPPSSPRRPGLDAP